MNKRDLLINIPPRPGVYKFKDKWGNIIYVGASKNLKKRVSSYFQKKHDHPRLRNLVEDINHIEYEIIEKVFDVFIRERALIGLHKPKYNVRWLDDKQYPYLMITKKEDFPRLQIEREKTEEDNLYFGRQTQVKPLRKSLNKLRTLFPICDCKSPVTPSKRTRPCLNYDLKLCPGPCANKISKESYKKTVLDLVNFLNGDSGNIIKKWDGQMNLHATNQRFEEAAKIRDRLNVVKQITSPKQLHEISEFDVIGLKIKDDIGVVVRLRVGNERIIDTQEYIILDPIEENEVLLFESLKQIYQDENEFPNLILLPATLNEQDLLFDFLSHKTGKKVKLQVFSNSRDNRWTKLAEQTAFKSYKRHFRDKKETVDINQEYMKIQEDLRELLNSSIEIEKISCIDISTLQGTATVASVVTFKNGIPDKSQYRRFSLANMKKPDDVGSMKQVLTRFFQGKIRKKEEFPDLLILDGGKAQLSAAKEVFARLGIQLPYFGIAKKEEELVLPNKKNPVKLKRNDPVLQLIVKIRDEAHRFAITYNRFKREKYTLSSELDQIKGLGEKRKNSLIKQFSSLKKIKSASIEELAETPLIHKNLALNIYDFFRKK
ncbi:MAG: excinuclease ABC subunit UvrC [Candidatus Hodarchaeales archaeon]|jgi:excinuclease ABC subunit C